MVVNRLYLHRGLFIAFSLSYLEFLYKLVLFFEREVFKFQLSSAMLLRVSCGEIEYCNENYFIELGRKK